MQSQQAYSDHWETEVIVNLLLPSSAQHHRTASASCFVSQPAKNLPENDLPAYKSTSALFMRQPCIYAVRSSLWRTISTPWSWCWKERRLFRPAFPNGDATHLTLFWVYASSHDTFREELAPFKLLHIIIPEFLQHKRETAGITGSMCKHLWPGESKLLMGN